jgi:glycine cleavage system H protein
MSEVRDDLKYTDDHEWVKIDGDVITIGITDYAQGELGDIVFFELPEEGDEFEAGDSIGTVEAVKAVSDIYAPISGKIIELNEKLADLPETANDEPYDDGWIAKIEISDKSEIEELLSPEEYKKIVG